MNNIKKVIFSILLCFCIGWFLPDVVFFVLKKFDIHMITIKYNYLLGCTILLPINQYIKLQPQLDSTKIVTGLKGSEIARLNNILGIKKRQLKAIMIFLLLFTVIPLVFNMILSQPLDILFKLLIGSSLSNILYVFYSINISEEISDFEKSLFLKNQKRINKEILLNELKK